MNRGAKVLQSCACCDREAESGMEMYRFDWLDQLTETALDPQRPIVDPHHHLWDNRGGTYQSAELLADTTGSHNVITTVFVECRSKYVKDGPESMQPVGETRYVAAQAAELDAIAGDGGPKIGAIVSFADMALGDAVEEVLNAHEEAGGGKFRGIRHAVANDPHPDVPGNHVRATDDIMQSPSFHAGVAKLGDMGFSFDSWMYHPQLPQLVELARAAPQTSIILDHMGGPLGHGPYADDREGAMAQWRANMVEVATCPNVTLKVGGIGMDNYYNTGFGSLPAPPSSDEIVSYWEDRVHFCIETFGPDRCMFESNFPVDRQTMTYPTLWNALQKMGARYTDAEQDDLFVNTATRTYHLSP